MKRKIFMACAALVVSAAAVVGVKAYNYYSMPELMRANLEALSNDEVDLKDGTLALVCSNKRIVNTCKFKCTCGQKFNEVKPYNTWKRLLVYGECHNCHRWYDIEYK